MHRFYSAHADFSLKKLTITDPDEIHHIKDVLRLKAGDQVAVFNGQQQANVVIEQMASSSVVGRVVDVEHQSAPLGPAIVLACAVPKKAKFEFIIEKCTELGVDAIIPLRTKRSDVVFAAEKTAAKQQRFQKVAVNAAKQSGRIKVPAVRAMMPFKEALLSSAGQGLLLIPSLNGNPRPMLDVLSHVKNVTQVTIFIGPEGDFTAEEVALAVKEGAMPVSLGATVLKVDTAAIAAIALARFWFLR